MSIFLNEEKEPEILTRCGYKPGDSIRSFETAILEEGTTATGRCLHFAADILCSGGFNVWVRSLWDYALHHIGIGSPRVFVYLKKRVKELEELHAKYPDETLFHSEEYHTRIGEIIMVLREIPRKPRVVWPKVGAETHLDGWLRTVASASETAVLKRVWKAEGDLLILKSAGAELLKAISEGSTEKCLFWIRWLFDEESRVRKENKGANLTTVSRGATGSKSGHDVGNYIATLFAESYKDLASRNLIRMNEEYQCLLTLWSGGEAHLTASGRKQILGLLGQILCEVPRWKVAAAPALIKDPVQVSRAVAQTGKFFREVLANPAVQNNKELQKLLKSRGAEPKAKVKKGGVTEYEDKMAAYDAAMNAFLNRS
jgi:hypothetical protein